VNRTDRLMGILLELQARRETRAEDLAARFEVSVRTIYRDVQALSETGVPIAATPGKVPPLSFTPTEAGLLLLGEEFVRDRVDPALRGAGESALHKLACVLPPDRHAEIDRWRRSMRFPVSGLPADQRLTLLRDAITDQRVVRLRYHTYQRSAPEDRDVEPITVMHIADAWHVAAWCRTRRAQRLFRLERIDRLEVLPEQFAIDSRHAVTSRPARATDVPEARVRFDADAERWARERQPFTLLREEFDATGTVYVYALGDEAPLISWLLQWGGSVEVLAPDSLRHRLTTAARNIVERHSKTS
jgi:predicted DNA-binding transcriptional regulator YafY